MFLKAISSNIAPKPRIFSSEAEGRGRKNPRLRGYIVGFCPIKHHIYNIYPQNMKLVNAWVGKEKLLKDVLEMPLIN